MTTSFHNPTQTTMVSKYHTVMTAPQSALEAQQREQQSWLAQNSTHRVPLLDKTYRRFQKQFSKEARLLRTCVKLLQLSAQIKSYTESSSKEVVRDVVVSIEATTHASIKLRTTNYLTLQIASRQRWREATKPFSTRLKKQRRQLCHPKHSLLRSSLRRSVARVLPLLITAI